MTDVKTLSKKAFTWSVVVMTVLWSVGAAALVPATVQAAECPSLEAGDLFTTANTSAVYLVNADLKRMYFPSSEVFHTWYADFSNVKTIDATCTAAYKAAGGVNFRPGSRLFKTPISPVVYAVGPNNMSHAIGSEAVAKDLYGANWASLVRDLADVFILNYTEGSALTASIPHNGQLVKKAGSSDVYYVVDGKLSKVEGTLSKATSGDVRTVSATTFAKLEIAGTTVTATSVTNDPSQKGGVTTPTDTTEDTSAAGKLMVSLAGNTPAAGYIAKGAYNADFAKYTLKASGGKVRVDNLVLTRNGLGFDSDITTVRLFNGTKQVGSDQTLNTTRHDVTFKNLNWDLTSGQSVTLTVKADTVVAAKGTNDYFALKTVELEGAGTVSAALPIAGNAMQFHSVSVGKVNVYDGKTPALTSVISGSTNQEVSCTKIVTSNDEADYIDSITFTNGGTIANGELSNFVLRDGSTVVGTETGTFGSDGKVTIDMTSKPYFIDKNKSKELCLSSDIASGIKASLNKTIVMQIAEAKDVVVRGDSSKSQVLVLAKSGSPFTSVSAPSIKISQGKLTVTNNVSTNPTASAIINGVAHNKVAAYKFTAGSTEGASVTRIRLQVGGVKAGSNTTDVTSADLTNFELYTYDEATGKETQVGSSHSMSGSYVTFEDNNGLFNVAKSKNTIVHVYADVSASATWDNDAVTYIGSTNTDLVIKAKGLDSGEFLTASDIGLSNVDKGNAIKFTNSSKGKLTVGNEQTTPGATSVAKGANDVDMAHFRLSATGEDVSVSQIIVRGYDSSVKTTTSTSGASDALATNDVLNVRLYDITDSANPVQIGTGVATPSSGVASFSTNLVVKKDNYKVLKLVADVPTDTTAKYIHFALGADRVTDDLTSTGVSSSADLKETGISYGNVMTVASSNVTVTMAPAATQNVVANAQGIVLGTVQISSGQYEDVKISSLKVSVDDSSALNGQSLANSTLSSLKLVGTDGTQYGVTKNLTDGSPDYVIFSGITNLTIPAGKTVSINIKANVDQNSGTLYAGITKATDVVGTGATSGNSATINGLDSVVVGPATTINSVATLTFAVDASNPDTRVISVGASGNTDPETMLVMTADSLYEDVDITKLVFKLNASTGDNAVQFFANDGVKLYHQKNGGAEVLLSSSPVVSNKTVTFTFPSGALRIGEHSDDLIILKAKFKGAVSGGLSSATSPSFILGDNNATHDDTYVEAKGVSSQTSLTADQFNGTYALNVAGNDVVAYKAYPTFTYINPGSTLVNGAENTVFGFKAKANGGNISMKQLSFGVYIKDNGTVNSKVTKDLGLHTWKLYRTAKNGVGESTDLTNSVIIQDSTGKSIEGGTNELATKTESTIFVTWSGKKEEQVPGGSEYTYELRAQAVGFTTDIDNDYVRVRMNNTDTTEGVQSNIPYYLSSDMRAHDIQVLGSSIQKTTSSASLIWSDRSDPNHNATTGTYLGGTASSSGDWFNGYKIKNTPTNYSQLVR